jgi:aquaporin Z
MKSYIAEVFGTFCLVFIGCATIVTGGFGGILPAGAIGIGLSFGIAVIAMAYAIGPVSGAHLNPAVSLGAFLAGRLPAKDLVPYMIAQVIGGILGALGLYLIVSGKAQTYDFGAAGFAQNGWDPVNGYSAFSAFVTEVLATFVFVTVILGVTNEKHATAVAGLVIGLTLAALHFAFIPVSGNSLNPARAIGPALFAGGAAIGQLWLYIIAPLIGGAVAGVVAKTGIFEKD